MFLVHIDGVLTMRVVGKGGLECRDGGAIRVWLCYCLCLLRMRYVKYCMDVWCSFPLRDGCLGGLRLVRDFTMDIWMAPLTPTVNIIND